MGIFGINKVTARRYVTMGGKMDL